MLNCPSEDAFQFRVSTNTKKRDQLPLFSSDAKDSFNFLAHNKLLPCVENAIDKYAVKCFQNITGLSCRHFIKLFHCYIKSTFILWECTQKLSKRSVCIGFCTTHRFSDFFGPPSYRKLSAKLGEIKVVRPVRFIDNFLFFRGGHCDMLVTEVHILFSINQDRIARMWCRRFSIMELCVRLIYASR